MGLIGSPDLISRTICSLLSGSKRRGTPSRCLLKPVRCVMIKGKPVAWHCSAGVAKIESNFCKKVR